MEQPSAADVELLRSVKDLTERSSGRPPTLSELAVSVGLQTSSRANVQRQLARMRPTFVNWTATSRSLHLTPAGRALIDPSGGPALVDETPVSDVILPLLASGLTQLIEQTSGGKPLQAPYPTSWQRGLNILAMDCLLRQAEPPPHTPEAIGWCHRPVSTWPVRFSGQFRFLESSLLEDGQPTDFCRELAQGLPAGDAEFEISERLMGRIRRDAELHRDQEAYVAVRRYLIEHPVVSLEELLRESFEPALGAFGGELLEMYELVPMAAIEDSQVLLCGHCGWTLVRRDGRLQCGDDRCRVLTANFTRNTHIRPFTPEAHLHRVRRAIRRYVVAAGVYELAAVNNLRATGLAVELWPYYDRYDLRIAFPSGEIWAVDIKDWRFPHLLARQLRPLANESSYAWDQAFYAIPDDRVKDNPNYLTFLRNAATLQDFEILTISELVSAAREKRLNFNA